MKKYWYLKIIFISTMVGCIMSVYQISQLSDPRTKTPDIKSAPSDWIDISNKPELSEFVEKNKIKYIVEKKWDNYMCVVAFTVDQIIVKFEGEYYEEVLSRYANGVSKLISRFPARESKIYQICMPELKSISIPELYSHFTPKQEI